LAPAKLSLSENTTHPWLGTSVRVLTRLFEAEFWKIDTKFDGLSKILIKKSFFMLFAGNNNNMSKWKQVDIEGLKSFKEVPL